MVPEQCAHVFDHRFEFRSAPNQNTNSSAENIIRPLGLLLDQAHDPLHNFFGPGVDGFLDIQWLLLS